MFREGHYLEVIKASDGCLATAIVTIKEKTVEYKNKKITTNKWLDLHDWTALYSIIRRAIIRNYESRSRGTIEVTEKKKSTSRLEVTYKFETTECSVNENSLPTIRVNVAALRKHSGSSNNSKRKIKKQDAKKNDKSRTEHDNNRATIIQQLSENDSFLADNYSLEEYVPPELPSAKKKSSSGMKYVPSRKSMLLRMRSSAESNKYTPTVGNRLSSATNNPHTEVSYIPNSITSLSKVVHETYDPCDSSTLCLNLSEAYVPSSKGAEPTIEEYQPDFASKTMKFDDSYVPSSTDTKTPKEGTRKRKKESRKSQDSKNKTSSSSRSLISKIAKREL